MKSTKIYSSYKDSKPRSHDLCNCCPIVYKYPGLTHRSYSESQELQRAMAELKSWGELIKLVFMSLIFGVLGIFMLLKRVYTVGPKQYFYYKRRNLRPPVLEGTTYGEHVFVRLKTSRVVIHCVVDGPKGAPLMLFLHGFPEFWYSWRHQIKEFSKTHRTVAIDMRGYGDSSKPLGVENYSYDRLVADVDELISLLGYSSCILVAHDWGGAVAWGVAAQHPDKVEKLVIGNIPHPKAFYKHLSTSLTQLQKSWYVFFFQLPVLPIYFLLLDDLQFLKSAYTGKDVGVKKGIITDEDIECFKYVFADYGDLCGPVNYYRAAMRYQSNETLSQVTTPTLLIWGTEDAALEKEMAESSKKYVEHLEVKYIEGASHWIQQDCPAEFNSFMKEFLSK